MTWLSPQRLGEHGARVALVEGANGVPCRFDELAAAVEVVAARLAGPRTLVACSLASDCASVTAYLGALAAGHVVLLMDPTADAGRTRRIRETYRPAAWLEPAARDDSDAVLLPAPPAAAGRVRLVEGAAHTAAAYESLGLLLTTSGSTGSPKLVRLSYGAVGANATSIAQALEIAPSDVTITTLPLHYSYGLSVLHSHLLVGAATVLSGEAVIAREFWTLVSRHSVSSLAGVPYTYEMLRRVRFSPSEHPSIRVLTQAGGKLPVERVAEIHQAAERAGVRFYVMYGQTEATARIAVLPSARLTAKLGSVGQAIPGGKLFTRRDDEMLPAGATGEIVYRGPNVMLGYAECLRDLERADDLGGTLATGDLGHLDEEGFLFVTGRQSRLAKVFGTRLDLDDVERRFLGGSAIAVDADGRLGIIGEFGDEDPSALRLRVAQGLGVHPTGILVRHLPALPRLASGKVDYRLAREAL